MLIPGNAVPELKIETVGHGLFDLENDGGKNGTLVIQYRGLHCPICIRQMAEVEAALDSFSKLGVEVVMITTDTAARCEQHQIPEDRRAEYHATKGRDHPGSIRC